MTKIDYSLLYLITENARISLKEASRRLKKSSQRLKYNIAVLKEQEILKNCHTIFDYSYFGLIMFRVYFRWGYLSELDKNRIISELNNNPYVVSVYELQGEFELVAEFACPNPSRFNKELKKLSASLPMLNNYKIIVNLVTHIYPKHYLIDDPDLKGPYHEKIIGGDREKDSFDDKELAIMKQLLLNPTTRLTSLAKNAGMNVKTAKMIMRRLQRKKIVKGFKYILDTNKLNLSKCRLFLTLHNLSIEKEEKLMEYLLNTKEMITVNKTAGDWDVEIDIEAFDKKRVRQIIMQLREEFKEIIARFNLIEFYDYHKKSYLPGYLFE